MPSNSSLGSRLESAALWAWSVLLDITRQFMGLSSDDIVSSKLFFSWPQIKILIFAKMFGSKRLYEIFNSMNIKLEIRPVHLVPIAASKNLS